MAPTVTVDLMTRAEVAELLRVSKPTLSRWASLGVGPRVTWLGPALPRYDRADVLDWLRLQKAA